MIYRVGMDMHEAGRSPEIFLWVAAASQPFHHQSAHVGTDDSQWAPHSTNWSPKLRTCSSFTFMRRLEAWRGSPRATPGFSGFRVFQATQPTGFWSKMWWIWIDLRIILSLTYHDISRHLEASQQILQRSSLQHIWCNWFALTEMTHQPVPASSLDWSATASAAEEKHSGGFLKWG